MAESSFTDIDEAKRYRAIKKGRFTKKFNCTCKPFLDKGEKVPVKCLDELKNVYQSLQDAHEAVLMFLEVDEIEKDEYLDNIDADFEKVSKEVDSNSGDVVKMKTTMSTDVTKKKVAAPTFHGDRKNYYVWKANFRTNFESTDEPIAKLQLLEALSTDTKKYVEHMIIKGSIDEMFQELDHIYGDKRKISKEIISNVAKIPICSDVKDFRNMYETVKLALSQLHAIDCAGHLDHFNSVEMIEAKLPPQFKLKWAEIAVNDEVTVKNTFTKLLQFIGHSVKLAEQVERMDSVTESLSGLSQENSVYTMNAAFGYQAQSNPQPFYSPPVGQGNANQYQPSVHYQYQPPLENSWGLPYGQVLYTGFQQPNMNMPRGSNPALYNPCPLHGRPVTHNVSKCILLKTANKERQVSFFRNELKDFCRVCLRKGHGTSGSECRSTISCFKCKNRHFEFVHDALEIIRAEDSSNVKCYMSKTDVTGTYWGNSICPAHTAIVISEDGRKREVSVLYDSGSNVSMIREDLAKSLNLPIVDRMFLSFTTVSSETVRNLATRYKFFVRNPRNLAEGYQITAFGVPRIGGDFPALPSNVEEAAAALGVTSDYDSGLLRRPAGALDVLIGTDHASCLPTTVKTAEPGLILASNKLGGVIYGTHDSFKGEHPSHYRAMVLSTTCDVPNDDKVLDFFSTESLGVEVSVKCGNCQCGKCGIGTDILTLKEQQQLELVKSNMRHDPTNKVITASYPTIKDIGDLGDNRPMVYKSLIRLENDLVSDTNLADSFQRQFQDMVERGVAKKISQQDLAQWAGPRNYLPMQYVIKENSTSTPLRIVMDTVRKYHGKCVNDYWPKGPNLINNLLGLLIRFREGQVGFYGDISKMYQTVHTDPPTWHLHRLLWRDLETDREPDTYVITRNSFGSRPAGLVAILGLHMVSDMGQTDFPKGAECIRKQMYVDDCLDSADSIKEAYKIMGQVDECLAIGSFKIKEWKVVDQADSNSDDRLQFGANDRVLGVKLESGSDAFSFSPSINVSKRSKKSKKFTEPDLERGEILDYNMVPTLSKRIVTRLIMRIFDPLGLLAPFVLCLACLLSAVWQYRYPDGGEIDWDDKLPVDMDEKFRVTFDKMFYLDQIKFPRTLKPKGAVGKPWLISCSDSSTKAFGAVAYIRWKMSDGTFWCRIITSKYRVWPIKPDDYLSVVRGELQGALLASRIVKFIQQESRLVFEEVLFVVDSEIVRAQITSNSHALDVFTGRRIGEIRKSSEPEQWFWIAGKENRSADLLTRGTSDFELLSESSVWQRGPEFLQREFLAWGVKQPGSETILRNPDISVRNCSCTACEPMPCSELISISPQSLCVYKSGSNKLGDEEIFRWRQDQLVEKMDITRFSRLHRLHCATARAWHFLKWTPDKGKFLEHCNAPNVASVDTIEEAHNMWLRNAQQGLVGRIQSGKMKKMNPFIDEFGVWRANGRFKQGEGYHPVILEFPHPYVKLLATRIHQRGHNGVTATMAKIRAEYYVLGLHRLASQVRSECHTCRILDHRTVDVPMSRLPVSRVRPYYPFENISCDICGPFHLKVPYKITRSRSAESYGKGYALVITCLSTRSVHCEAMEGENTDSFLLAIRRMMSIRGQPRTCWSDNGGQIVSAGQELQRLVSGWDKDALAEFGAVEGIQWTYSSPGSPWANGVTEALVKSVRRTLKITLGEDRLVSMMELQTMLYEVASLLNERPIAASLLSNSPDVEEGTYLCPNQLLYGRSTSRIPAGPFKPVNVSDDERFHATQTLVNQWWDKWTTEFLPTLLRQSKWFKEGRSVKIGDVVHVRDLNPIRGHWKIGEVIEILPSRDGQTRNVKLRYKTPGPMPGGRTSYIGARDRTQTRDVKNLVVIVASEERIQNAHAGAAGGSV